MTWSTIIIEGYCLRKTTCAKDKYNYCLVDSKTMKWKKVLNEQYNKNYKTPRKPGFCPGNPCFVCLDKKCKFFWYTDADKEEYLWDNKYWESLK